MNILQYPLSRLREESILKPFNCSDSDLNDFFYQDAKNYNREKLAVTYIFESEDKTIAYFSLLNDKVDLDDAPKNERNRFNRSVPNAKRYSSYPSVKVGRLAVSSEFSGKGLGSQILDFIKGLFSKDNKTGCRYITIDAYIDAIIFYEKNGFKFLTNDDVNENTRLMYFDLMAVSHFNE